jgi:hypothetical protein
LKLRERPRFKCWEHVEPYKCWRDEFVYENNYRIQPIYFGDDAILNEYVFSCFTRDRQIGEVREYFVSQEYNLTETMPNSSPLAGRFVFCYDEENELSLNALAEEAAIGSTFVDKTRVAELYYLKFRANNYPSKYRLPYGMVRVSSPLFIIFTSWITLQVKSQSKILYARYHSITNLDFARPFSLRGYSRTESNSALAVLTCRRFVCENGFHSSPLFPNVDDSS